MQESKKISVVGLGYVGLPVLLALTNNYKGEVVGFDVNEKHIGKIQNGECPLIDEVTEKEMKTSAPLTVSTDKEILNNSDVYIICVPTPVDENFNPVYDIVISAAKTVAEHLEKGNIVVLESTVNPGTCEEIMIPAMEEITNLKAGSDYDVVHAPERINPGDSKNTLDKLPRNIGGTRKEASEAIKEIYKSFINADIRVVSNLKVAEASKIIENSFRDLNIAFVNELAKSFDAMDVDLIETIHAASSKFSFMPHWPGPGVGGHCISVDPYYLIMRAGQSGFNHRLLKEVRNINNSMPQYSVNKMMLLLNQLEMSIKGTKIALLGLSFKPEVGDMRQSPALQVRDKLLDLGADLIIYDPHVPEESNVESLEEALDKAEVICITTNHKEIETITPEIATDHGIKAILDTRNCLEMESFKKSDILYTGIGRN